MILKNCFFYFLFFCLIFFRCNSSSCVIDSKDYGCIHQGITLSILLKNGDRLYGEIPLNSFKISDLIKGKGKDINITLKQVNHEEWFVLENNNTTPFPEVCTDVIVKFPNLPTLKKIKISEINLGLKRGSLKLENDREILIKFNKISYSDKSISENCYRSIKFNTFTDIKLTP